MAKKDNDNFDFETESEGKGKFNLVGFFNNLTKQQKGIILATVVGIVLVIAIVVVCVVIGASNNEHNNDENNNSNSIVNMYISTIPVKTVYYVGDNYDYSGLTISVKREDSEVIYYDSEPDVFTITGFDSSAPVEEQTITVEYEGFSDNFTIKIIEVPISAPTLIGVHLDPNNMPVDTCKWGYAPDIRGAKLVCEYSNGTTKIIDLAYEHLNDYEEDLMAAQVGDTVTIPVVYDEDGVIVETSFTVTITE